MSALGKTSSGSAIGKAEDVAADVLILRECRVASWYLAAGEQEIVDRLLEEITETAQMMAQYGKKTELTVYSYE